MNGIKERSAIVAAFVVSIAAFFLVQLYVVKGEFKSLPEKVLNGIDVIPSLFALLALGLLILLGSILIAKGKWILGLLVIGLVIFTSPLHSTITSYAKTNLYQKSIQKIEMKILDLPLSAHPKKYRFVMGDSLQLTPENKPKKLRCAMSGCFIQVNGLYRIHTDEPQKTWDVFPIGNCEVDKILSQKTRSQLPIYSGSKKPCFGALMFSEDGYNYKPVIADGENFSNDEITRKIGKLFGKEIYVKLYVGNGSYALSGQSIDVMTYIPNVSP